jgi:acetylornithine/N-succinyldiaminopimelate aminotransferase
MSTTGDLLDRDRSVLMQTYRRQPAAFVSGEGCWLTDAEGRRHLDCLTGLAVVAVGHANERVAAAVADQMRRLVHVSNLYVTEPMVLLAERLTNLAGLDRVFFANCGATANETAIKLARRHAKNLRGGGCVEIVSLDGSFHGRTLATLAATGQPEKQAPFAPLPPGFVQVPPGDVASLQQAMGPQTAAVMVETIQGEGGVIPLAPEYLQAVRELCNRIGALMIVDDVQAGMGRTGSWFSWQQLGFTPDIATVAKALGNGLPVGACLATADVAGAFRPGDHGTTFGGGPVVCTAALAVIEEIEQRGLLDNSQDRGEQLSEALGTLRGVAEVRGRGLLVAARLTEPLATEVVRAALDHGLVVNAVLPDAVRFAPPLIISEDEIGEAVNRFGKALAGAGVAGG